MQKLRDDRWSTNPPSVTTFLSYPNTPHKKAIPKTSYFSPACGFGWGFQFSRCHEYRVSKNNPNVQELTGQVNVLFEPRVCAGIKLRDVLINVKAKFPIKGQDTPSIFNNEYPAVPLSRDRDIGIYREPFHLAGQAIFEITLIFHWKDHLSFPTTPPPSITTPLLTSLDGFAAVDTKFYLYSAKIQGRPGRPRTVFANASLLGGSNTYLRDLVSRRDFDGGVTCDLEKDTPEVVVKLSADSYGYDSDSDLESLSDEEPELKLASLIPSQGDGADSLEDQPVKELVQEAAVGTDTDDQGRFGRVQGRGKAFAINGTAYQTWKAFIFYAYTNEIHFCGLRSQRGPLAPVQNNDFGKVECSPKSMYRLADYVGAQALKDMAREGIRCRLTQENIVQELFSSFTSKYQELIDMEVEFFVQNLSPKTAREFDRALQLIILGVKPYCYRVLAFTIRRMRGEKARFALAALDRQDEYPNEILNEDLDERLSESEPQGTEAVAPLAASPTIPLSSLSWGNSVGFEAPPPATSPTPPPSSPPWHNPVGFEAPPPATSPTPPPSSPSWHNPARFEAPPPPTGRPSASAPRLSGIKGRARRGICQ